MAVATLVTVAFDGDDAPAPGVIVEILGTATAPDATAPAAAVTLTTLPTASLTTPAPVGAAEFVFPIEGACLPEDDGLMPGAPREYRKGTHEGIDFYDADNCAFIGSDTEVLAAASGTVIRADVDYIDLTAETLAELQARVELGEGGDPEILDIFRGRQVWIDHGGGLITRYAHLGGISDGVIVGRRVEQGDVVAYVGESGSAESVNDPGTQAHLHFEIREGESYRGYGLAPDPVRQLYRESFAPSS